MGDVIRLSQFRKQKAKEAKESQAAENRRKFGRTKAERAREKLLNETEKCKLDQHKLPPEPDPSS